jgi:hypothetical protein
MSSPEMMLGRVELRVELWKTFVLTPLQAGA